MNDFQKDDKDLTASTRFAAKIEVEDKHVQQLVDLRLEQMRTNHGTEDVNKTEHKAICLLSKTKKTSATTKMLTRKLSEDNPAGALIMSNSCSTTLLLFGERFSNSFSVWGRVKLFSDLEKSLKPFLKSK